MTLAYIIIANLTVSLLSLAGLLTLVIHRKTIDHAVIYLVSLAAGTLMGSVFFHLLPEAARELGLQTANSLTLLSFITFFLMEKLLRWRHCHQNNCSIHAFGYMNLIGDAIHNLIDGLIIAAAFNNDIRLGLITTLAIAAHELPQEIGDFGVLIHAGFAKRKALLMNLLTALTAVLGALLGHTLSSFFQGLTPYLLPLAAGGFLYIAASDLLPEIRQEKNLRKLAVTFSIFLLGITIMLLLQQLSHY